MLEKTLLVKTVARTAWHLLRYAVAAFVSTLALAILPILAVTAFVGLWLFGYLLVFVGLLPIDEPMSLLITPPLLVIFEIVVVAAILLLAAVFTVVGVLPLSLFVEFVFWRFASQRSTVGDVLARLVSFVVAGVGLGVLVGVVELLRAQPETLVEIGIIYMGPILVSVCSVFLFGLILTLLMVTERGFLAVWRKISGKRTAAQVIGAGTGNRPSATPEPDVRLSPHPAFEHRAFHRHYWR